jgi:hypothetical protein
MKELCTVGIFIDALYVCLNTYKSIPDNLKGEFHETFYIKFSIKQLPLGS